MIFEGEQELKDEKKGHFEIWSKCIISERRKGEGKGRVDGKGRNI